MWGYSGNRGKRKWSYYSLFRYKHFYSGKPNKRTNLKYFRNFLSFIMGLASLSCLFDRQKNISFRHVVACSYCTLMLVCVVVYLCPCSVHVWLYNGSPPTTTFILQKATNYVQYTQDRDSMLGLSCSRSARSFPPTPCMCLCLAVGSL